MNRGAKWATLIVGIGLGPGCLPLPEINLLECGNGVLEPANNEDCDVAEDPRLGDNLECGAQDDPIRKCRYLCGTNTGAPSCPVGWRCGADGICLFASGEYREIPTAALAAPAKALKVGDFDGDDRDDLLALTNVGLSYRFSSDTGLTDSSLDIPFDAASNVQFTAVDVDRDGITDVAVPLGNGVLVLRGSPSRLPETVPYPQITGLPNAVTLHSANAGQDEGLVLGIDTDEDRVCLNLNGTPADRLSCTRPETSFSFSMDLDGTDRSVTTSTRGEAFIMVNGDTQLHVFQLECAVNCFVDASVRSLQTIDLPEPGRASLVVDVDGRDGTDLLIKGDSGTMVAYRGPVGFADAVMLPFLEGRDWLDAADLDGDGRADYLTPQGVFVRIEDTLTLVYNALPPWREARFGDFNGDGRPDVASTAALARVRVLLNAGDYLFNHGDLVTAAQVRDLTVADFNGDFADDIAVIQDELLNDVNAGTTVAVSYGVGFGVPKPPINMGRVDFIESLDRINLQTSHEREGISDLLIGTTEAPDGGGERSYTLLSGGRFERLSSLVTPPNPSGLSFAVVALPPAPDATTPVHLINLRLEDAWLMRGSGGPRFDQADMELLDIAGLCGTPPIDPSCLVGQNVRLAGGARDSALLLDTCSGGAVVLTEVDGEYGCQARLDLPNGRLAAVDLNRNQRPEILVITEPVQGRPNATVAWDIDPRPLSSPGLTRIDINLEGDLPITDVVAIDVDADRDIELMILTEHDLRLGDISVEEGFVQRRNKDGDLDFVLEREFSPRARLAVADVNGDGLLDVVISDDAKLFTLLGRAGQPG